MNKRMTLILILSIIALLAYKNYEIYINNNAELGEIVVSTDKDNVKLCEFIDEINSKLKSNSDAEKARAAYDFVLSYVDFDIESFNEKTKESNSVSSNLKYVLDTGKATCIGYAKLYKEICNRLGLQCEVIGGIIKDASGAYAGHSWNIVNIDGNWYYVDTCSDDCTGEHYEWLMQGENKSKAEERRWKDISVYGVDDAELVDIVMSDEAYDTDRDETEVYYFETYKFLR